MSLKIQNSFKFLGIDWSPRRLFWLVSVISVLIYAGISLVAHYNFRTTAFDLGIFNQALYQYAHLELGPNTIRQVPILLADHMELLMFLMAPFWWIFGSYTLLVLQIVAVVFGAFGVYKVVEKESDEKWLSVVAALVFYMFFGVMAAVSFDFHNNVIGAMLLPWMFYFFSESRKFLFYICLMLFLFSKEYMALIGVFFGVSMLLFGEKENRKHALITIGLSALYFVFAMKMISYFNGGGYDHWHYLSLGENSTEALKTIFTRPFYTFSLLFDNEVKRQTWIYLLLSGGAMAIFKPRYSFLMLPILAIKFFADESKALVWTHQYHYSIEFAPIVAIGAVLFVAGLKKKAHRKYGAIALVGVNFILALTLHMHHTPKVHVLFKKQHYFTSYRGSVVEAIGLIPDDASVSAQNQLVPHLVDREQIFVYPRGVEEADFVIFSVSELKYWPFASEAELNRDRVERFEDNAGFEKVYDKDNVYLYERY